MTAPLGYFQNALTLKRKKELTHCINTVAPPPIVDHRLLRHMVYLAKKYPIRRHKKTNSSLVLRTS